MEKLQYEIRRDSETVCVSNLPQCGYSNKMLRDMMAFGYRYYIGGRLQRKIEPTGGKVAQQ